MKEDSGQLTFTDDCLVYESATYGRWRLPAESIRLVGEFTNQSGPFLDDYFLLFFKHGEDGWHEASFYAEGREETMDALARRLPGMAALELSSSADFNSRVLWPKEWRGQPLFDFCPLKRGLRGHDRLLDQLSLGTGLDMILKTEFRICQGPT